MIVMSMIYSEQIHIILISPGCTFIIHLFMFGIDRFNCCYYTSNGITTKLTPTKHSLTNGSRQMAHDEYLGLELVARG